MSDDAEMQVIAHRVLQAADVGLLGATMSPELKATVKILNIKVLAEGG